MRYLQCPLGRDSSHKQGYVVRDALSLLYMGNLPLLFQPIVDFGRNALSLTQNEEENVKFL